MSIIAYVYESGYHCPKCAEKRFGCETLNNPDTRDREGNPIRVVFSWDDIPKELAYCDDCMEPLE